MRSLKKTEHIQRIMMKGDITLIVVGALIYAREDLA